MKDIIILGTGGNCADILDALLELNLCAPAPRYRVAGFLDDNPESWGASFLGFQVLGPLTDAGRRSGCWFVNGIGSYRNYWQKPQIIARTGVPLDRFETVIHPRASVSQFASVGRGTVVLQNASITALATVGNHIMVLSNSVISHHARIGDYSCIASGACVAGGAQIGATCYLGMNSTITNGVKIGEFSLIGAGAVVLKDVAEKSVVVGNPVRVIRKVFA